jgi:hypothetical protein
LSLILKKNGYFWLKQVQMKRYLIIIIMVLPFMVKSQNDTIVGKKILFDQDFKFKDGIFLTFEDVKRNNPVSKARIITDLNYNDYTFFEKLMENETIDVLDMMGQHKEIKTNKIWGFSQNGTLFIKWNNEFNRIPVFGSLCHFIADKTYIDNRNNPYYNNYYNNYNYYSPYNSPYNQTVQTELRQYILDMETGQVMDFISDNVEIVLQRDAELGAEFAKLKNKKKDQLKFLYLRKYNEKKPFYLITE